MAHYWLIVILSWISSASLQYISSAYEDQLAPTDIHSMTLDPVLNSPLPTSDFFNIAPTSDNHDRYQREKAMLDILFPQILLPPSMRIRRTPEVVQTTEFKKLRTPNYINTDGNVFLPSDEQMNSIPFVMKYEQNAGTTENNASDINDIVNRKSKRSFSPWGGKRDVQKFENNMWTWKRAAALREPSMPKRVRFSPWGGKRSSQLLFKPGAKASKLIFSNSIPELSRIVSNYLPKGGGIFNMAGFQLLPGKDKRHPIRILALGSKLDDRTSRDALPFRAFIEAAKFYKPGHPYSDVSLKKDGKRKVKFSAWGGKRSPPIIGPIWSPSTETGQDHTLNTILLIRNDQDVNGEMTKAL